MTRPWRAAARRRAAARLALGLASSLGLALLAGAALAPRLLETRPARTPAAAPASLSPPGALPAAPPDRAALEPDPARSAPELGANASTGASATWIPPEPPGRRAAPGPEAADRALADAAPSGLAVEIGSAPGRALALPAAAAVLSAELLVGGLAVPTFATGLPGDPRVFVVERAGLVRIVEDGAPLATPFLDIRSRVGTAGEGGLLGLAFDPGHAQNGLFYVYFTDRTGVSVLSRFELRGDPDVADAATEEVLLTVAQPFANHNGGTIAFSPVDGHLYLGLGDGGSANDPLERAQNGTELLGKMLRLDVSGGYGSGYAIPADNPFVLDPGVLDEIWALGLRNPFRFAFDWETGDLWIGDVGQNAWEEVDFELAGDGGHNYGWDVEEGSAPSPALDRAQPPYVNAPPFTDPIHEYPHTGGQCSITGGSVYRGPLAAENGLYFFGDYCTGQIWSLDPGVLPIAAVDRSAELAPAAGVRLALAAIGEDGFGALLVVHLNGNVYRLGHVECSDGIDNDGDLAIDFPDDADCLAADGAAEAPAPEPDPSPVPVPSGGGDCGLGFELVLLLPPLLRAHRRHRNKGRR